jgi:hypothetical protein
MKLSKMMSSKVKSIQRTAGQSFDNAPSLATSSPLEGVLILGLEASIVL